jgi:hypothetical protein
MRINVELISICKKELATNFKISWPFLGWIEENARKSAEILTGHLLNADP